MGLIKAAVSAVGSTLHDQWKEYIRCEDLGQDILMKRVSTPNGVISKDSAIQVAPGQIAVIFQNGQIRHSNIHLIRQLCHTLFSLCQHNIQIYNN